MMSIGLPTSLAMAARGAAVIEDKTETIIGFVIVEGW
jgi:hypothetical protein